jgi:hypothetical protein
MNVSGEARVARKDSSDPGKGWPSENPYGIKETRASRNRLVAGSKQSGAPSRMRPRMLAGSQALKIAASVPPSECPTRNGLLPRTRPEILATHLKMASTLTAPTSVALMCRWRSRPQHQ